MSYDMIGMAVYHSTDIAADPERIGWILTSFGELLRTGQAEFIDGRLAGTDRFTRQKKLTEANLRQLQDDLRQRQLADVSFSDRSRAEQDADGKYASLHLGVTPAKNPRVGSEAVPRCPFLLYLLLPREVASEGRLASVFTRLAEGLDAGYAFIHVGTDFRDALMEVTTTPMFAWGQELTPDEERKRSRLLKCQNERVLIGEIAGGAYWGNFWSAAILDKLGGREQVRVSAPADLAQEAHNGGLYVQLTPEVPPAPSPAYLAALHSLEKYVAPASAGIVSGSG